MQTRRNFLKSSAALPVALAGSSMFSALASFNAQSANVEGYKALVCVFLFGGMDCHDTLIPFDQASYDSYSQLRASLLAAYAGLDGGSTRVRQALLPLAPALANFGGREFALPPELAAMHTLFEAGNAAVVGNVGPLLQPTDKAALEANAANLPKRLFSHNDQQSTWMSFAPEGAQLGWGGRFGDAAVLANANNQSSFTEISLAGNSVFLSGDLVSPYQIGTDGVPEIGLVARSGNGLPAALAPLLRAHFSATGSNHSNLLERDFATLSQDSFAANDLLQQALQGAPQLSTPFPMSGLGAQLRAIANTIAVRDSLGASRQVFFAAIGGFDTHSAQANDLPALQRDIGDSIAAFYAATEEMGVASDVTTFTASDFGRTLTVNGDGTDHGWGAHHFVVGGAVNGGDIYGDVPPASLGHNQDSGNGRLIPSVSVEQYAAPLGAWFGLDQSELNLALPGLANFPAGALSFL